MAFTTFSVTDMERVAWHSHSGRTTSYGNSAQYNAIPPRICDITCNIYPDKSNWSLPVTFNFMDLFVLLCVQYVIIFISNMFIIILILCVDTGTIQANNHVMRRQHSSDENKVAPVMSTINVEATPAKTNLLASSNTASTTALNKTIFSSRANKVCCTFVAVVLLDYKCRDNHGSNNTN